MSVQCAYVFVLGNPSIVLAQPCASDHVSQSCQTPHTQIHPVILCIVSEQNLKPEQSSRATPKPRGHHRAADTAQCKDYVQSPSYTLSPRSQRNIRTAVKFNPSNTPSHPTSHCLRYRSHINSITISIKHKQKRKTLRCPLPHDVFTI